MLRVLLGVLAAAIIVVAVVLGRTFMIGAPARVETGAAPISVNSMEVAQHLAAAVRFQTVSFGASAGDDRKFAALDSMAAWLKKTYPDFHHATQREIIGHSLLFTWKGSDPKRAPVLIMAHMDVVPIVPGTERDWTHGPFSGDIADGFVWGRGAIDDKGSLVAIVEAANRLAADGFVPKRTILFAFGEDEEVGGNAGSARIAEVLKARGIHLAWVIDEGGAVVDEPFPGVQRTVASVSVAEKGYLSLQITAYGTGGHSSRPTNDLAIVRLADAVRAVVDHPFASGLDDIQKRKLAILAPDMPFFQRLLFANLWLTAPIVMDFMGEDPGMTARLHTTIAPTMISGGVKDNVLPPKARVVVNFRLHPRDTIDGVIEHVRKAIDDPRVDIRAVPGSENEASRISDISDANGRYISKIISASFNGIPVVPDIATGATDSRHYLPLADDVFRFDPFHLSADDQGRVHGTNERLAIGDLGAAVGFYMRLMRDLP